MNCVLKTRAVYAKGMSTIIDKTQQWVAVRLLAAAPDGSQAPSKPTPGPSASLVLLWCYVSGWLGKTTIKHCSCRLSRALCSLLPIVRLTSTPA